MYTVILVPSTVPNKFQSSSRCGNDCRLGKAEHTDTTVDKCHMGTPEKETPLGLIKACHLPAVSSNGIDNIDNTACLVNFNHDVTR